MLIILLAFLVRFLFLGNVPTAITNDQLHYILNARSFFLTGTDLSGTISLFDVLLFRYPLNELPQAELPFFLVFPMVAFFPMSLTTVVFPNVLLSTGTVVILYLIAKTLFHEKVALLTALVATFNPWFIFTGRTLYEVVPATFFYLCALYVLLIAKGWRIVLAFPLLLLAFYSYIGTKLLFLPVLFLIILYSYYVISSKKYLKQYSILFLLGVLVVIVFLIQMVGGSSETSRLSEIITPSHPAIAERVDAVRSVTIQHPLLFLFENKITIYLRVLLENFFHIFSPEYLFLKGDGFFSLERHGLFYLLDGIFLIIGSGWVFSKKRALFFLLISLILTSTLPQIIHDPEASGNFTPHIALLFPFFILLIAVGIYHTIQFFSGWHKKAVIVLISAGYLFLIMNFFHIYFYQLPLRTGLFDFPTRLLSQYAHFAAEEDREITVFSPETPVTYRKYLFYSNALQPESIEGVKKMLQDGTYSVDNITFVSCSDDRREATPSGVLVIDYLCDKPTEPGALGLPQLKDSGSIYRLYGDTLCGEYELDRYVESVSFSHLQVEKLTKREFCETYVLRLE